MTSIGNIYAQKNKKKLTVAHGESELRPKRRVETYKSQPCTDPAKDGSRECLYGVRCNYAHPGEGLRRPFSDAPYWDHEYAEALERDYPGIEYPFGIFI